MNEHSFQWSERGRPDECLSDLTLDRLRCGELDEATSAAVELHLEACESCRSRARSLGEATVVLQSQLPNLDALLSAARAPSSKAQSGVVSINKARTGNARRWAPAVALLSAAAAMFLLLGRPDTRGDIRLKGNGGVTEIYVRRGLEVFRWQAQTLMPGDQLRFSFRTNQSLHVAVLSRDGANAVNQYFPARPESFGIGPGETLSTTATELDATLGSETLWVVYCQAPFSSGDLIEQLERTGNIQTGEGCSNQKLSFDKAAP